MESYSQVYTFKLMNGGGLLDILETLIVGEWGADYNGTTNLTSITKMRRIKYIRAHGALCNLTASSRFAR